MLAPDRIAQGEVKQIAGLRRDHRFHEAPTAIPVQWKEFNALRPLAGEVSDAAYGIICGHTAESFEYMAGVEVKSLAQQPPEMGRLRLQPQTYAIFEHRGPVSTVRETWSAAIDRWLPSSGYVSAEKPDFERYGPGFNPATGSGDIELWIAVEPKR